MYFKIISSLFLSLTLISCATNQGFITNDVTFKIDGGKTITLPMTRAGALPSEDENYKITFAGNNVAIKKGAPEQSDVNWAFSFAAKSDHQIERVTVEQVTPEGNLILLVQDNSPSLKAKSWAGKSKPTTLDRTNSPWLYENSNSTFLFKFTIVRSGLPAAVIYQPSLISQQTKAQYLRVLNG